MPAKQSIRIGVYALNRMSESKVITDMPSGSAINNYEKLSSVLIDVIKNSDPHFTIGIYGEWGTGKTTLMRMMEKELKETNETDPPKILPIWFDAWRYEGEEQLAVIAILKTITHEISGYQEVSSKFGKVEKTLDIISTISLNMLSSMVGAGMSVKDVKEIISKKLKFASGEKKPTIYFDLLNEIKKAMGEIRNKNEEFRMVVFVDDLDRCSPQKALRVLESMKIFFDIPGFIYVLGISHETLSNLISQVYRELNVEGREYIKKIIQVPITLPAWENRHLKELLNEELNKINPEHRDALSGMKTRNNILDVADNNPRQLKRLINSFIVTYDTYSGDGLLNGSILFRCLSIQKDKPKLFSECVENEDFRKNMMDFIDEMRKIYDIIDGSSRESESEAITTSRVPLLNLVVKLREVRDNKIKDGDASGNEIKGDAVLEHKIRAAFYNFLQDKYKPESNKTEDSEDSNQPEYVRKRRKAFNGFSNVVESDELIKMDIHEWFSFGWTLTRISGTDKDLSKYKDAINMMREDLKMGPDSRNLNKN